MTHGLMIYRTAEGAVHETSGVVRLIFSAYPEWRARGASVVHTYTHTKAPPIYPPSPLLGGRGHKGCLSPVLIMSRRVNHREAAHRTADVSPGESLTRYAPVRSRPFDSRSVCTHLAENRLQGGRFYTVSLESIYHRKRLANRTGHEYSEMPR